jgi:hypothetical protein
MMHGDLHQSGGCGRIVEGIGRNLGAGLMASTCMWFSK